MSLPPPVKSTKAPFNVVEFSTGVSCVPCSKAAERSGLRPVFGSVLKVAPVKLAAMSTAPEKLVPCTVAFEKSTPYKKALLKRVFVNVALDAAAQPEVNPWAFGRHCALPGGRVAL